MKHIFKIVFIALFTFACTDDLLFQYNEAIVVNSLFNPDSVIMVSISKTENIASSDTLSTTDNAVVNMYSGTEKRYPMLLSKTHLSPYNEDIPAQYLKPYEFVYIHSGIPASYKDLLSIEVETDGQVLSAFDSVPYKVEIINVVMDTVVEINPSNALGTILMRLDFQIFFKDPANLANFYSVGIIVKSLSASNGSYVFVNPLNFHTDDPIVEGFDGMKQNPYPVFSDRHFDGKQYKFKMTADYHIPNLIGESDTIEYAVDVCLYSLSKAAYMYCLSYHQQKKARFERFTEPVSLYSNIEGCKGIFAIRTMDIFQTKFIYNNRN